MDTRLLVILIEVFLIVSILVLLRLQQYSKVYRRRYASLLPLRLFTFFLGVLLMRLASHLWGYEQFGLRFLSGFVLFTGAQITLWSIGIALELFGNSPTEGLDALGAPDEPSDTHGPAEPIPE